MKATGIAHIPRFDDLKVIRTGTTPDEPAPEQRIRQFKSAAHRLQRTVKKALKRWATAWYHDTLTKVTANLQKMGKQHSYSKDAPSVQSTPRPKMKSKTTKTGGTR